MTATTHDTHPVSLDDSSADAKAIARITESIRFDDPTLSVTYGAEAMSDIAQFADDLLSRVRAKDAGPIGESLTDLLVQVKSFDAGKMGKKSVMEHLPVIGSLFSASKRTMAQFNTVSEQIGEITTRLEDAMLGLLKDIAVLEELYEYNKKFHMDLNSYLAAGKARLDKAREEELPPLVAQAEASGDPMDAQKVKDFTDTMLRFERRLHDLQLSRVITVQTAPQIRLIQSNNQTLAEKIQTSILSTIPIWKGQMVLNLSLQGQQTAAHLQKDVADTTNELLRKNAQMLQQSATATAIEVERSVVDIATLRDVQSRLVSTIEETMNIAKNGRVERLKIEQELHVMEQDLKVKLTALAKEKTQGILEAASTQSLPAGSN